MRESCVRRPPYRAGNGHEGPVINRAWSSRKAQKPASDQKWAEVCSGCILRCAMLISIVRKRCVALSRLCES
jgi:hypothetical protein